MARLYTVWQVFAEEVTFYVVKRKRTIRNLFHIVAETPEQAVSIGAVLPRCFAVKTTKEACTTVVQDEQEARKESE